jgi:hypothetical protein
LRTDLIQSFLVEMKRALEIGLILQRMKKMSIEGFHERKYFPKLLFIILNLGSKSKKMLNLTIKNY